MARYVKFVDGKRVDAGPVKGRKGRTVKKPHFVLIAHPKHRYLVDVVKRTSSATFTVESSFRKRKGPTAKGNATRCAVRAARIWTSHGYSHKEAARKAAKYMKKKHNREVAEGTILKELRR
jgi:hypothetical protein